jgi:hypothetical protein
MMRKIIFLSLFLPLFSFAQIENCIDPALINPDCLCPLVIDPVCGCDGEMYDNSCLAECAGNTSWSEVVYDSNGNMIECATQVEATICDSMSVEFTFLDSTGFINFNFTTFYTSDEGFAYAGFVLLDLNGDTVAAENINTAINAYGVYGQMEEDRVMEIVDGQVFDSPFYGTMYLVEGLFAGELTTACSFPFEFSLVNNTDTILGQWYSEEEEEFLTFTEDSVFLYYYNEYDDCYEIDVLSYSYNDQTIIVVSEEDNLELPYSVEDDVLSISFEDETIVYVSQVFDVSSWMECEYEDISFDCDEESGCYESEGGEGMYGSYEECFEMCQTTSVNNIDKSNNSELIKITDLLGKEVNFEANRILFYHYDNGTVSKVYRIK